MKIIEIAEDSKPAKKGFKVDLNSESTICTVAKDTNDSGLEEMPDASMKLYKEKTFQVIEKIKELKLPKSKEQLRLITKRSFNSVSFLKFIADQEKVIELVCCIYSINHEAAIIIDELIKTGRIEKATLLISNLRNKAHREKEQLTKDLFIGNPKIKLIYASSHSKIISFKTENQNYYTIEGSGNLSFNSRIEQYVIDNDRELFEFTKQWTSDIVKYLSGKKELSTHNL
jgi:hypothetical protein